MNLQEAIAQTKMDEQEMTLLKQIASPQVLKILSKFCEQIKLAHQNALYTINYDKDKDTLLKNQYLVQGQIGIINEFKNVISFLLNESEKENDKKS